MVLFVLWTFFKKIDEEHTKTTVKCKQKSSDFKGSAAKKAEQIQGNFKFEKIFAVLIFFITNDF